MPFSSDDENAMNLDQPATRLDIRDIREEIQQLRQELESRFEDVHRHIDVSMEAFKSEFANLYDWTQLTTSTLGGRVDNMERGHDSRLSALEHRVTRLEAKRK
jgi:hypothetical protein